MAPELLVNGETPLPSTATDLFSLAVTTYEALTGKQPFVRDTAQQVVEALRKTIPPLAWEENPSVPPLVSRVIHKAMAKNPATRYETVEKFYDSFERALRGEALPEFSIDLLQSRLSQVENLCNQGQSDEADPLLRSIEDEGERSATIVALRQRIDQAVGEKKIRVALKTADGQLDAKRPKEAWETIDIAFRGSPTDPRREKYKDRVQKLILSLRLEDARAFIEKRDFVPARQSLNEALAIRRTDTQVSALFGSLRKMELTAEWVQKRKIRLFDGAKQAIAEGYLEGALARFERLRALGEGSPQREIDDTYEEYYRGLLGERTASDSAYEKARQWVKTGDSTRILEVGRKFESTAEGFRFAALRLRTDNCRLQVQLLRARQIFAELDDARSLSDRLTVLEGCEGEDAPPLVELRRNAEAQLDLLETLLAKAHLACGARMFADALRFLEVASELDPTRKGIVDRIQEVHDLRNAASIEDEIQTQKEEVEWLLTVGDYLAAFKSAEAIGSRYQGDHGLSSLLGDARSRIQGAEQARMHYTEATDSDRQLQPGKRLALLREANKLDENDLEIRHAYAIAIAERAEQMETGAEEALKQCREAHSLAPEFGFISELLKRLESLTAPPETGSNPVRVAETLIPAPPPAIGNEEPEKTKVFPNGQTPSDSATTDPNGGRLRGWRLVLRGPAVRALLLCAGFLVLVIAGIAAWSRLHKGDPPQFVVVALTSTPPDATIVIDGKEPVTSPANIRLTPGSHRFRASKTGYAPTESDFSVPVGHATQEIQVTLNPLLAAVEIASDLQEFEVKVDNNERFKATGGRYNSELLPGSYRIEVFAGDKTASVKMDYEVGVPLTVTAEPAQGQQLIVLAVGNFGGRVRFVCGADNKLSLPDRAETVECGGPGLTLPLGEHPLNAALLGQRRLTISLREGPGVLVGLFWAKAVVTVPTQPGPDAIISEIEYLLKSGQYRAAKSRSAALAQYPHHPRAAEAVARVNQLCRLTGLCQE